MTTPLRAAIYARFSTDKQSDASIADQERACRDYAARQGLQVVETYSDRAMSGASVMRSGLQKLMRDAREHAFDVVLSEGLDRFSRNQADIAQIYQTLDFAEVKIETVSEGAISEMHIGLKGTITEVPDLRIIEDELWQAVRTRQGALVSKGADTPVWIRRRPRTLFSGLMTCGCCGSGFSKMSKDSFGCSAARNKGKAVCTNVALIKQADLEARVLDALAHHLMDAQAVAAFCDADTAERNRLAATAANSKASLETDLGQVKRDHAKLADAIIAGVPLEQVKDKMISLDARRQQLEGQLESLDATPAPVAFHPKMAETYRDRVAALIRGLDEEEGLEETREALRGLVEKIVLVPQKEDTGATSLDVDLHGSLGGLLQLATGESVRKRPA